jgi:3-deoxy-D-manno-octulosonate 8-phosphate phosphatase (KDO 8-P phosphatase)
MDIMDFKKIKLLIMDVDGVLTDGGFYVSNSGDISRKFNVLDGFGIRAAIKEGIELAIITGGKSDSIIHRSDYLGVKHVFMGREDKLSVYLESIKPVLKVKDEEVAFIGDDVYDIPLMEKVGISVTVPNAHEKVKKAAKYITSQRGGEGAVREVIDLIIAT